MASNTEEVGMSAGNAHAVTQTDEALNAYGSLPPVPTQHLDQPDTSSEHTALMVSAPWLHC